MENNFLSGDKKQVVIFDLDGTVITLNQSKNGLDRLRQKIEDFLKSEGLTFNSNSIFGMYDFARTRNSKMAAEISWMIDEFELSLLPDASILLDEKSLNKLTGLVSDDSCICLVTSNGRACVNGGFKSHLIPADLFDVIVTRDDVEQLKPNPEPLEKAVSRCRNFVDVIWFIGDSTNDMNALINYCSRYDISGYFTPVSTFPDEEFVEYGNIKITESLNKLLLQVDE